MIKERKKRDHLLTELITRSKFSFDTKQPTSYSRESQDSKVKCEKGFYPHRPGHRPMQFQRKDVIAKKGLLVT